MLLYQQEEMNFQKCTPRKKIIFLKTHKTGSTTLQNIFYRFGFKEKLMFLLPKRAHFLGKVRKGFIVKQELSTNIHNKCEALNEYIEGCKI